MRHLKLIDEFNKEAEESVILYSHEIYEGIFIMGLYLLKRIKKLEKNAHYHAPG